MSVSINRITIVGNVGKDPEVNTTQSGKRFARFSVATNRSWKDRDGTVRDEVQWHRVTVWFEGLVGIVEQHVNGGDKVYVDGRMEYSEYTDNSGATVRGAAIVAQNIVLFRAPAPGATAQPPPAPAPTQPAKPTSVDYDDLPF